MYQVGDMVVYPVHGAGVVEGIESREVAGCRREYYILQLPYSGNSSGLRVMVPLEEAEKVGLRGILPLEELGPVLGVLEGKTEAAQADLKDEAKKDLNEDLKERRAEKQPEKWNKRQRVQLEAIKSGNVYELAATVRELAVRDRRRPLAAGEKRLFEQAREILFSELWLAADAADKNGGNNELSQRIRALLAQ